MPSHLGRDHLTGNQIHTTDKHSGNVGKNLNVPSQPANWHTLTQLQSAQADFAARSALRRGFNRWLLTPPGNTTGNASGNTIGNTGNTAQSSPHHAIPGQISLSAIGNHCKKRNRGKNGNASHPPHRHTMPLHNPSGNIGKISGTSGNTAISPRSPNLRRFSVRNVCPARSPATIPAIFRQYSGNKIDSTLTARLARVKNEKMRNFRRIVVMRPDPAPA